MTNQGITTEQCDSEIACVGHQCPPGRETLRRPTPYREDRPRRDFLRAPPLPDAGSLFLPFFPFAALTSSGATAQSGRSGVCTRGWERPDEEEDAGEGRSPSMMSVAAGGRMMDAYWLWLRSTAEAARSSFPDSAGIAV